MEYGAIYPDFSRCSTLKSIGEHALRSDPQRSKNILLDLSKCTSLEILMHASFFDWPELTTIMLPASLKEVKTDVFSYVDQRNKTLPKLKRVIWKGCTCRPSVIIDPIAFGVEDTLDDLVTSGRITELFVP